VGHRVECQWRVDSAGIHPSGRKAGWGEAVADEKNNAKRFLDDPMLKIENAERREEKKTEKRDQLVAPFHASI
jgi:hypothetical protein